MLKHVRSFFELESAGGIVLVLAAVAALTVANSPWGDEYRDLLERKVTIGAGSWRFGLSVLHWINDLWMAVFFLLVGLEIKREVLEGQLSTPARIIPPAVAALGGVVVPAAIYVGINAGDAIALRGWAIPAATDIAFALGVLLLLGRRVPDSLRVFVTAVAIIDDLGAIVVIALFYTAELSLPMLGATAACCVVLFVVNRLRVMSVWVYLAVGLALWFFVHESGPEPTLCACSTAFAIPMRNERTPRDDAGRVPSPVQATEHALHPWIAYLVLPVFAFANAGVLLSGVSPATLTESIPLGIGAGLVLGKMVGVFGSVALLVRFSSTRWPEGARWPQVLGVAMLCGIGFTMSLFIGGLAFEDLDPAYDVRVKLGVLAGSIIAALAGTTMLLAASNGGPRPARAP